MLWFHHITTPMHMDRNLFYTSIFPSFCIVQMVQNILSTRIFSVIFQSLHVFFFVKSQFTFKHGIFHDANMAKIFQCWNYQNWTLPNRNNRKNFTIYFLCGVWCLSPRHFTIAKRSICLRVYTTFQHTKYFRYYSSHQVNWLVLKIL